MESKSFDFLCKKQIRPKSKTKPLQGKIKATTMTHIKGIPPAINWSNKSSAIILGDNFLYISNTYIANLDLVRREFFQLITSSNLESEDKFNILVSLGNETFLAISNFGYFFIFHQYSNSSSKEDLRCYYKEIAPYFRFSEITQNAAIKTAINIRSKNLLICGSSEKDGALYVIKYIFQDRVDSDGQGEGDSNDVVLKLLYAVTNVNCYVTDIIYINHHEIVISSSSNGELMAYHFLSSESLSKLCLIETGEKCAIFSIDAKVMPDNDNGNERLICATLNKNGTLMIFSISLHEKGEYSMIWKEKDRFNDKSIDEKYLFFIVKCLESHENNITLLVTSNKGRLFTFEVNISASAKTDSTEDKKFHEIPENPHSMAIFNILEYNDKLVLISSDHLISVFQYSRSFPFQMNFEYDIKTLGTKPRFLMINKTFNRGIYLMSDDLEFYLYSYRKKLNGLHITMRRNLSEMKMKNIANFTVSLCAQAKFNENIFALVKSFSSETMIVIYDFNSDMSLATLPWPYDEILSVDFYPGIRTFKDCSDNSSDNFLARLFTENCEYDLVHILTESGLMILWDFVKGKVNKMKVYSATVIKESCLYPILNRDEDIISVVLDNTYQVSLIISNQLYAYPLYRYKLSPLEESSCMPSNVSQVYLNRLICDFHISKAAIIGLFIELTNLRVIAFTQDFCDSIAELNSAQDYSAYVNAHSLLSKCKDNPYLFIREYNFKNISNSSINNISVHENNLGTICFLTAQLDGIVKVFSFENNPQPSIILMYSIKAHLCKIIHLAWVDSENIVTTSLDHSAKVWNITMCRPINLQLKCESTSCDSLQKEIQEENKLISHFSKVKAMCLYQQSCKNSQEFITRFENFYAKNDGTVESSCIMSNDSNSNSNSDYDFLLFSYFISDDKNFKTAERLINLELSNLLKSSSIAKNLNIILILIIYIRIFNLKEDIPYLDHLKSKLPSGVNFSDVLLSLNTYHPPNDPTTTTGIALPTSYLTRLAENPSMALDTLITSSLFIEALILCKLIRKPSINLFLTIIDKIKASIFSKQIFQSSKCQRVIEILRNYFKL